MEQEQTDEKPVYDYRSDGRIERYCEHGIGHTVYAPRRHPAYWAHGCDGCCKDWRGPDESPVS